MMHFESFIGAGKKVRLNPTEKQAVKAVLGLTRSTQLLTSKSDGLFAYEKSLMRNSLADMTKQKPALTMTAGEAPLTINVWHGSVFRHLQPFVLTTRD